MMFCLIGFYCIFVSLFSVIYERNTLIINSFSLLNLKKGGLHVFKSLQI
jgi:hypothetical protein